MAEDQQKAFNQQIIEEFRANGGKVAMFPDYPMIILHTIGRKSGNTMLVPLVLIINDDNDMLIFGSAAGAKDHPAWALNLRANPSINVEVGTEEFAVRVEELEGDELAEKLAEQAGISDVFAGYVTSAAPRTIPVFRLHRV